MTNLVNAESLAKTYGTTTVLADVSLGIAEGERVGVVGRNGGGKTTLLRILMRAEEPDAGRVTHTGGLRVGWLPQHVDLPPDATVRDVVLGAAAEHEWAGDARVRAVLHGLGVHGRLDSVVGPMSGGERRRVALAALLVAEHDLVVLDEPTNHLDVEGIAWLAAHLAERRCAQLVVTHDRWFLDAVCTATWEVADGRVHAYEGGYSAYVLARAERERVAAATEQRRQNLLRKELAWLRRGPPARTSKPRFRIEAANALIADEPPARDTADLVRFATARLGKTVVDVEDADVAAGPNVLLRRLTWHLGPGDRVGVVGVNGSGKTTLLRALAGDLPPASGRVVRGQTVRTAYLDQEVRGLPAGRRVLEAVEEVARHVDLGNGRSMSASQLLERFLFDAGRQWTPVEDLSGGERRRLQLLRLLMTEPNLLLLDEPTNDLDIETLSAVEDLLDGWPGTLVVVSHDRYFLERTCDRVMALFGDGALRDLPGGVDEYLARVAAADEPATAKRERSGDTRAAKKELTRLERLVERLERDEARLHDALAANATDYAAVASLDAELRDVQARKAAAEEEWLLLSEEV
ncbi:MAG TPA: ATP-binding cassette domain-containing protein [Mycobacteriales bacterium]|jgi:ATP-binding cassette subfamily F protein uup|nr:ATP-binding cassette domain-containing protein [Mycobacteriales bacterium]